MNTLILHTPIGPLQLVSNGSALLEIQFPDAHSESAGDSDNDLALQEAARQLEQYFKGERQSFDLPLAPKGTEFQRQVWQALAKIPYGELRSYRDIARGIGREKAVRAVGAANGRNPLPIVVPCHRVIGSDGTLTGFAGGLETKRQLLQLEGALLI